MKRGRKILFFSRGKGRGHAVPDAAIARELVALEPDVEIVFVSYSVGAATLRNLGWEVIDLQQPENPLLWDCVSRIVDILRNPETCPDLVVSHEEFAAVPIAKTFGLSTVFITDWFGDPNFPAMQGLRYADEIIFMDEPGYNDVPPYIEAGRIHYVGCVFRPIERIDRLQARSSAGLSADAIVALIAPGGADMHSERHAPIFNLILGAFDTLPPDRRHLIYIVPDAEYEVKRGSVSINGRTDVTIMKHHSHFSSTMMASDLVITTGNRTPILESQALGIPSLTLSFGYNPVDDQRICRIPTNTPLRARGLDPAALGEHMRNAIARVSGLIPFTPQQIAAGRCAAIERLRLHLPDPPK